MPTDVSNSRCSVAWWSLSGFVPHCITWAASIAGNYRQSFNSKSGIIWNLRWNHSSRVIRHACMVDQVAFFFFEFHEILQHLKHRWWHPLVCIVWASCGMQLDEQSKTSCCSAMAAGAQRNDNNKTTEISTMHAQCSTHRFYTIPAAVGNYLDLHVRYFKCGNFHQLNKQNSDEV